jgi:gag-polypeptide of LTR copia-type
MSPVDAMVYEEGWYRSRYGIDKLREGNYPDWKWDCQLLLKEYKVWDVVTGQIKRPVKEEGQPEPLMENVLAWEEKDEKALAIIGFSVIDEPQRPVRQAKSAKEAWDELEKVHAPNEKAWDEFEKLHTPNDRQRQFARQFALSRQLHSCKMSSNTALKDHEREFSNIIEALRAAGEAMDPMEVITRYLLSFVGGV